MRDWSVVKLLVVAWVVGAPSLASAYYLNGRWYSNGVECDLVAGGLGNVLKSTATEALVCAIEAPPESQTIVGLALCQNPGGNNPPGLFPASVAGFSAMDPVDPAQVAKNGKYYAPPIHATAASQYPDLVGSCPNLNYTVVDFVPCAFTVVVSLVDVVDPLAQPYPVLATETYDCAFPLDTCLTLSVDKATGMPERREYTCTKR